EAFAAVARRLVPGLAADRGFAAPGDEAVAAVRERTVPLDAVAMAAQHEAVAAVVRRLGTEDREALTREHEAVAGVVGRDHVGEARERPVHGLDAGGEAAHAARAGDGEPARAAAHHLDADTAAAAGEQIGRASCRDAWED